MNLELGGLTSEARSLRLALCRSHTSDFTLRALSRRRQSGRSVAGGGRPRTGCRATARGFRRREPAATMRPPMERTLASLCWRERRAVYRSLHRAARAPGTLFAAICSPWPLPPSTIPRSARPPNDGARDVQANRRIVHRLFAMCPMVVDAVAQPLQCRFQMFFEERSPRDRRRWRYARAAIVL